MIHAYYTADCSKLDNRLQGLLICGQHHTSPYTSMYVQPMVQCGVDHASPYTSMCSVVLTTNMCPWPLVVCLSKLRVKFAAISCRMELILTRGAKGYLEWNVIKINYYCCLQNQIIIVKITTK